MRPPRGTRSGIPASWPEPGARETRGETHRRRVRSGGRRTACGEACDLCERHVRGGTQASRKGVGGDFLEKRGNVWNEKESFTLSSNRRLRRRVWSARPVASCQRGVLLEVSLQTDLSRYARRPSTSLQSIVGTGFRCATFRRLRRRSIFRFAEEWTIRPLPRSPASCWPREGQGGVSRAPGFAICSRQDPGPAPVAVRPARAAVRIRKQGAARVRAAPCKVDGTVRATA